MSKSPLVSYTKISPNRTSPRNHKIDTVSIHCAVGQFTAKQLLNLSNFVKANDKTGASCNYAVGCDGSIGCGVSEKDRSWCTSNAANDHRAITIEVASDTKHPYKITDAAYEALIELLVDICQRNKGISELRWLADKSLIGKVEKQNMTVHRWFAKKACPGDYLYKLHGKIADTVNARLKGATDDDDVLYRVQTGAFQTQRNAENLVIKLKANGFDTYLVKKDSFYKVQVGAFSKKANAEKVAAELKKKGYKTFITTEGGVAVTKETKKSTTEIAREVIQGKWGVGAERKALLTKAGYSYSAVQKKVNQLM